MTDHDNTNIPPGAGEPHPKIRKPVFCHCGRPLTTELSRDGVWMRCDKHGVQFRYVVDCGEPKKRR